MTTYKTAGEAFAAARAAPKKSEKACPTLTPAEQAEWDRKMLMQLIADALNRLADVGLENDAARLRYRELSALQERVRRRPPEK